MLGSFRLFIRLRPRVNQPPTAQQRYEQLPFGAHLIKPNTSVFHDKLVERHGHRTRLPDFTYHRKRHRTELGYRLPCEPNLQALGYAVVGEAANPYVVDGGMFASSGSTTCSQSTVQSQQPAHYGTTSCWPSLTRTSRSRPRPEE